jgi:Uma2 family endonuclease
MAILHSSERRPGPDPAPEVRVPPEARTLDGFRAWLDSPEFPETGRVDYLAGEVVVDVSPEDIRTHATVKTEIAGVLYILVKAAGLGEMYIDRGRVSSPVANLSAEPDLVVVLWDSLESGRVRYVPGRRPGSVPEVEGAPDLVVEIVSDGSVAKDRRRLPPLYARAGVRELWLVDARGERTELAIHHLAGGRLVCQAADAEGWSASAVLARRFRLRRQATPFHGWEYFLDAR